MGYDSDRSAALVPPPPRAGWGPVEPGSKIIAGIGTGFTLWGIVMALTSLLGGPSGANKEDALFGFAVIILCFGGVGGLLAFFGWRKILRRRRAWRYGEAAQATITAVALDHTVKVNGRRPPKIAYRYTLDGKEHIAETSGFLPAYASARPGQTITVLVDRADPRISVPWLP